MPISLYLQAAQYIKERIDSGEYAIGTSIPTENELAATLRVSRPTVRQAIAHLASDGLLVRVKGSGTFVYRPKLMHESTSFLSGYRSESEKNGRVLRTQVLSLDVVHASGPVCEKLGLPEHSKVTRLARLRRLEGFNDGRPVVYTTVFIPFQLFPQMAELDFTDCSLYEILDSRGLSVRHASRTLEVMAAAAEISSIIEISPFEPAIFITSVGTGQSGTPVEYSESYYPAGCSRFMIEIDH